MLLPPCPDGGSIKSALAIPGRSLHAEVSPRLGPLLRGLWARPHRSSSSSFPSLAIPESLEGVDASLLLSETLPRLSPRERRCPSYSGLEALEDEDHLVDALVPGDQPLHGTQRVIIKDRIADPHGELHLAVRGRHPPLGSHMPSCALKQQHEDEHDGGDVRAIAHSAIGYPLRPLVAKIVHVVRADRGWGAPVGLCPLG